MNAMRKAKEGFTYNNVISTLIMGLIGLLAFFGQDIYSDIKSTKKDVEGLKLQNEKQIIIDSFKHKEINEKILYLENKTKKSNYYKPQTGYVNR